MGIFILFAASALLIILAGSAALAHHMAHPPRKSYGVALARQLPTDPRGLGFDFEQTRFSFDDHSSTTGWLIHGEREVGPIVVLTHGFADSRYGALTWVHLLAPFASHVVVYDLRAHGDSTARTSSAGMIEANDLVQILRQLPEKGLHAPVVLFGYSLGAGVSITAAADAPADLKQRVMAVIGDGVYRFWSEPIAGQLRNLRWPPYPFVWLASLIFALRHGGWRNFDRERRASRLDCPLLLLHGSDDSLCPLPSARRIAEAATDGQLVVMEGGHHGDLAESNQVRYLDCLRSFFARIAAQPPVAGRVPSGEDRQRRQREHGAGPASNDHCRTMSG